MKLTNELDRVTLFRDVPAVYSGAAFGSGFTAILLCNVIRVLFFCGFFSIINRKTEGSYAGIHAGCFRQVEDYVLAYLSVTGA